MAQVWELDGVQDGVPEMAKYEYLEEVGVALNEGESDADEWLDEQWNVLDELLSEWDGLLDAHSVLDDYGPQK